jgi:ribonucleoside-diphosphate reductase beta chain
MSSCPFISSSYHVEHAVRSRVLLRDFDALAMESDSSETFSFVTTGRGLRRDEPAMRLYEKAKRLGVWNPSDIDFSADVRDWQALDERERDLLLHVTSLFVAGEEGVTVDLLPLVLAIAAEGRLEEELYLTTFLWEEGKHVDFFRRFLDEVARPDGDMARYHTPSYRTIFYEELPSAMSALLTDRSPEAQVRASVTYNMIVEGVLAETGYHGYFEALERNDLLPGLREGIALLKRDESRHIAYGIFLLSRLIAERPELWPAAQERMEALLPAALGVVVETFRYDPMPFGLELDDFLGFATTQFQHRLERIERGAEARSVELVYELALEDVDAE